LQSTMNNKKKPLGSQMEHMNDKQKNANMSTQNSKFGKRQCIFLKIQHKIYNMMIIDTYDPLC